jgi:hypothetical protein
MSYAPVYITLGDRPKSILESIDGLGGRKKDADDLYKRRRWIPWALFAGGFPFLCLDLALVGMDYPFLGLSCVAGVAWLAAIVMGLNLRKARMADFPPELKTVREILDTIRDDVSPKAVLLGHIDLTGAERKEKVSREQKDARGRTTKIYSDEWLRLKAKLFDGNVLRVSAFRKIKKRDSYWGRGRSGKMKMKPAKLKGDIQELNVRVVVNPELYEIVAQPGLSIGQAIGPYQIQMVDTNGGMITLNCATSKLKAESGEILPVLQAAYSMLKRKS